MQASRRAFDAPTLAATQSRSASSRSLGWQSSTCISCSTVTCPPCSPRFSGHGPKKESSVPTSAPARSRISALVSSEASRLKLPQWPSWPSGSWRILMIASMCLLQRFTVRSTILGKRAVTVRRGRAPCPGSMSCSLAGPWKLTFTKPLMKNSEGISCKISLPSQVTFPSIGSMMSVWPPRNGPPTPRARRAAWPADQRVGP
mmetsp:Transcript_16378/g.44448  ORF Transcript_16378/g.44448 Transcript_16378/m.44448 type:complete len:202 (-) Transcript_16378:1010-1615(-)